MASVIFSKKIFLVTAILLLATAVFSETEEELKKRILSGADLAGQSMEELLAADDEADEKNSGKIEKRLPSTFERDVPYTAEEITFMDLYYNHGISSVAQRRKLHEDAIASAEKFQDEYARLVHLARAEYYYGIACIETFDLASFENLKDVEKKSDVSENANAGAAFDKAIEYAQAALKIREGSDAYTIYSHSISATGTGAYSCIPRRTSTTGRTRDSSFRPSRTIFPALCIPPIAWTVHTSCTARKPANMLLG